jgi:hypothetical protein
MGGIISNLYNNDADFLHNVDKLASKYILNMNHHHLNKMLSLDYCNTLLTSIQRLIETFTPREINVLYERVVPTPPSQSQSVQNDFIEQCHNISTFYVFIAHLYAIIILTINPKYRYNPTSHYNHLQPVIPSLNQLYMDDDYDIMTEKFQGMSPSRQVQFNDDLHKFYLIFTGNTVVPPTIQRFDDILLKDYSKTYSNEIISKSPDLFEMYAKYIQKMLTYSNDKQAELFRIIRQLFFTPVLIHPKLTLRQVVGLVSQTRNIIIQLYVDCETDVNEIATIYDALIKKGELDNIIHQYKCIQQIMNNIDM